METDLLSVVEGQYCLIFVNLRLKKPLLSRSAFLLIIEEVELAGDVRPELFEDWACRCVEGCDLKFLSRFISLNCA